MASDRDYLKRLIEEAEGREYSKPIVDCEDDTALFPFKLHPGQIEAWEATERIVLMLAGTQGGKTVTGARLLLREIQRTAVPGEANDYLIVGPNIELLKKKALPEFEALVGDHGPWGKMAEYNTTSRWFTFSSEGSKMLTGRVCPIKVFVGYATKPDSLESATYKGIWPDECGQTDFKKESWEALQRRAAIKQARIFLTTTPYSVRGWLKELCEREDKDVRVVRFSSDANPEFPRHELERMEREWPKWRYELFCLAKWSKPAGAIYDCFDNKVTGVKGESNVCEPFIIPETWKRHVGLDFGEVNMAAVFVAESPEGDLFIYDTYRSGGQTVNEHAKNITNKGLTSWTPDTKHEMTFTHAIGGTWTGNDPEFRRDFTIAGFPIHRPPVKEVETGISRVYAQVKTRKLKVFSTCEKLIAEFDDYSRKVNEHGDPLSDIQDKETYHLLDATRYIVAFLRPISEPKVVQSFQQGSTRPVGRSLRRIV